MADMELLKTKIEYIRQSLYALVQEKGINHPEVIQVSQMLDLELNKYDKLIKTICAE